MSAAASAALQIEIETFEFLGCFQLDLLQIEFELLGCFQSTLLQIEIEKFELLGCLQLGLFLGTFQEISWAGHVEVN